MNYQYWVVRYVPNAARGEFVNIGMIVGGAQNDWAYRRVEKLTRAGHLGGDTRVADRWLKHLESQLVNPPTMAFGDAGPSVAWVEELRVRLGNTVQLSKATPAFGASAQELADLLFATLVVEPVRRDNERLRTQAVENLYSAYLDANIAKRDLRRNLKLVAGKQSAKFDFAVNRHGEIQQMTHVWSFRRSSVDDLVRDIQASTFAIDQLREKGGELRPLRSDAAQSSVAVAAGVPVKMLYVKPKTESQIEALGIAQDGWDAKGISHFAQGRERELVAA